MTSEYHDLVIAIDTLKVDVVNRLIFLLSSIAELEARIEKELGGDE